MYPRICVSTCAIRLGIPIGASHERQNNPEVFTTDVCVQERLIFRQTDGHKVIKLYLHFMHRRKRKLAGADAASNQQRLTVFESLSVALLRIKSQKGPFFCSARAS